MKTATIYSVSLLLGLSVSTANAAMYSVYGSWTDTNTIGLTNGSVNDALTGVNFAIYGTISTDTSTEGYQITGGTLHASGWMRRDYDPGTGPMDLYLNFDMTGSAGNTGAVFSTGTVCLGFYAGDCSGGVSYLDAQYANQGFFDGTGTFSNGAGTTLGLQLLGGVGGPSFTVAQPGDLSTYIPSNTNLWTGGTGVVTIYGSPHVIFLGGELAFTNVPVPAAAWLFGSALLGLVGINRRRR